MSSIFTSAIYYDYYLEVEDNLAHDWSKVPGLRDVTEDSGRETDDNDEEVGDREVHDEQVGDGAQLTVVPDDEADHRVADDSQRKHENVVGDQTPLERRRPDVLVDHIDVLFVADTVLVAAVYFHRVLCHVHDRTAVFYRPAPNVSRGAFSHCYDLSVSAVLSQL